MSKSKKKERERKILDLVFGIYPNLEVLEQDKEKPDFWLKFIDEKEYFGVEITERYHSESSARLKNIPSYSSELINKVYRHKDDIKNLKITPIEIYDKDQKLKLKTTAIVFSNPDRDEFLNSVKAIIEEKNKKLQNYSKQLHHIDLIIFDNENSLHQYPPEDFMRYFFSSEIKETVITSSFREIFFITTFKNSIQCTMPLKLQIFYNETFMFSQLLFKFNPQLRSDVFEDPHYKSLVHFLIIHGFTNLSSRMNGEYAELIYNGYGLVLKNPNYGFTIRSYLGTYSPADSVTVEQIVNRIEYSKEFTEFLKSNKDKEFICLAIQQIKPK